jgi:hypothetical protein
MHQTTARQLEVIEGREGVLGDLDAPSPVLVIAFGGQAMRLAGAPPFEFFGVLREHDRPKKLFVRDHHRSWYHRGVVGLGDDIASVATALQELVDSTAPTKVVALGSSSGGYAALLFGRLMGVDEVHAFGPQTFISADLRQRHGDERFRKMLPLLLESDHYQSEYGDLNELFSRTPHNGARVVIHYCEGEPGDGVHARHMQSQPGVELRKYPGGDHNVAKYLRDRGTLTSVLTEITSYEP